MASSGQRLTVNAAPQDLGDRGRHHALAAHGHGKFISSSMYTHGRARKDLLVTIAAVI
jgi:hypothetical protein